MFFLQWLQVNVGRLIVDVVDRGQNEKYAQVRYVMLQKNSAYSDKATFTTKLT